MIKMTRKEEIQKKIEDLQNELMEILDIEEKSKLKQFKSKYEGKWVLFNVKSKYKLDMDRIFNSTIYYYIKEIVDIVTVEENFEYKYGYTCKVNEITLNDTFGDKLNENIEEVIDLNNVTIVESEDQVKNAVKDREKFWKNKSKEFTKKVFNYLKEE